MEYGSLMLLYEDNSVEVHCADGSRLLLSPCGSEFLFEKAVPASAHSLQPPERVHQRTPFAISIYREKLLQAVDFRNQHSDRPYLPSNIIPPKRKKVLFTDLSEAKWPGPDAVNEAISMHNGDVKVRSLDGHACLCLPELQQEFTVEFLCKVSQTSSVASPCLENSNSKSTKGRCATSTQNCMLKPSSQQPKTAEDNFGLCGNGDNCTHVNKYENNSSQDKLPWSLQSSSFEFCTVTQYVSVSSCPKEWQYPLSLAFEFYRSHTGNIADFEEGKQGTGNLGLHGVASKCRTVTCLPLALPLSCCAPYLHRWHFGDFLQRREKTIGLHSQSQPIKVVWNKGVLYRCLLGTKSIEVYPGDGSVFKSEGSFLGTYFIRSYIQEETKQREEITYSISSLPPDMPGSVYSVQEIMTQAIRVLQYSLETTLSLTHSYNMFCWKESPETGGREMLPFLLAEKVVPAVGRVLAYSDNKVHAVFYDGVILTMMWDFRICDGQSERHQDANTGWCKLISPEGAQQLLQIDHPGLYERYIRTVVECCRSWTKDRTRCTDTMQPAPEESWSVAAELEKIKRFNFLVENSNIPNLALAGKKNTSSNISKANHLQEVFLSEDVGNTNVAETLEKTSKVINDIDSLLVFSTKQH